MDAVIYLWDFNGQQMACRVVQGRGATFEEHELQFHCENADPFCTFKEES
jgi:hypothetical protein